MDAAATAALRAALLEPPIARSAVALPVREREDMSESVHSMPRMMVDAERDISKRYHRISMA